MSDERSFSHLQPYYDLMVDWEKRLAHEGPFYQRVFSSVSARRVLDCACGTGRHLGLFARWGMTGAGSDLDPQMVAAAHRHLKSQGVAASLEVADFRDLAKHFPEPFQAVICTGNSLAMVGSLEGVRQTVANLFAVLAPGGVAVVHTLNYAALPQDEDVIEGPRVRQDDDRELLFLKIFRKTGRHCDIQSVVLAKQAGEWTMDRSGARVWALEKSELENAALAAGFVRLQFYGGYEPKPFDAATSRDLILVARKEKHTP